jgi:thiamine biosynthesis lipoprotein
MDPGRGAPLPAPPASVTVIAPTCAEADAWATALMVAGPEGGAALASRHGLGALFLTRDGAGGVRSRGFGQVFANRTITARCLAAGVPAG